MEYTFIVELDGIHFQSVFHPIPFLGWNWMEYTFIVELDGIHFHRGIGWNTLSSCNWMEYTESTFIVYRVAKTRRMPFLHRSFSAKEPYN